MNNTLTHTQTKPIVSKGADVTAFNFNFKVAGDDTDLHNNNTVATCGDELCSNYGVLCRRIRDSIHLPNAHHTKPLDHPDAHIVAQQVNAMCPHTDHGHGVVSAVAAAAGAYATVL